MSAKVYLDHNASTPLAACVSEHLKECAAELHGNPSSSHWAGKPAAALVALARQRVALLLGVDAEEIVFVSGGSEANNHALKGTLFRHLANGKQPHFVTCAVEHPAILEPLAFAKRMGAEITIVAVDRNGRVSVADIERALRPQTALVSLMHANNEVGTLQPVAEVAALCRQRGILCHSDAAQSVGKIPVNARELGVDMLSLAGHKFGAPKGVGALYVRKGVVLEPLVHGAGHEAGRRAGTENILLVSALGVASQLAMDQPIASHMQRLRERLHQGLRSEHRVVLNGHPTLRLPNTLNLSFLDHLGDELLTVLPELAASTGSACHANQRSISPVLKAMGYSQEQAQGALRLSIGRCTTEAHIDRALALFRGITR